MDAGLGVRWPLSPYATALAAGAIFAFCIALWKRRAGAKHGPVVDPSGRIFGKDLDPKKDRDACDKPGKKKDEGKAEGTQNFPVLALTRGLNNYEHLCLSGSFGAIPRILRRNQTLENPNLYSVIRRRNTSKENNNWQETSTTSPNFSCIYQQSLYFASELPRLNARFLFNLSPHLQTYIRQFGYAPNPEVPRSSDFDHFDVAIKPEILKNKPITRSAVCFALQSQLHKYLEEPFREKRINERSVQAANITEENDDDSAPDNKVSNDFELNADSDIAAKSEERPCTSEFSKNISSDSSLWDSGYGEKAFDERCNTPKKYCDENNILMEELDDTIRAELKTPSEGLNITKYSDLLKETSKNDFLIEENDGEEISDNASSFAEKSIDNENFLDEERNDDTATIEYSTNNLNIPETSDSVTQRNDSELSACDKILEVSGCDTIPQFSSEHASELNPRGEEAVTNFSDTEAVSDEVKKLFFDENVDVLQINKCSDKELGTYHDDMQMSSMEENNLQPIHSTQNDSEDAETLAKFTDFEKPQSAEGTKSFSATDLERVQDTISSQSVGRKEEKKEESADENLFRASENTRERQNSDRETRAPEVDAGVEGELEREDESMNFEDLERIQNEFDSALEEQQKQQLSIAVSPALEAEKRNSRVTENAAPSSPRDVTEEGASRDPPVHDERGTFSVPRQMDRETGERSVAVESTVTTETTLGANGDARLSTAVVSRLTLDEWEDSLSVKTTVSEEVYRPTFEEFVPLKSSKTANGAAKFYAEQLVPLSSRNGIDKKEQVDSTRKGRDKKEQIDSTRNGSAVKEQVDPTRNGNDSADRREVELPSSPRVDRLKGLLNRDEERRTRSKFHHLAPDVGGAMEGEWDRLLRDVLASVSELERWERRHCDDVSSDAEDAEHQHPLSQSDSSFAMEEEALSPSSKGETPTKVKNLRFKLDPDVFDVPSDDSFYDDENDDDTRRGYYKKQSKYRAFSSLEVHDEPVRLVSVQASVVPAGQKMVARPVGIDLRVRLTEERQSKRAHVSTSPSQAKRRSPVSDRGVGWCQELSPVTENVDWRESFTPVTPECKSVLNGILKTPSPKIEPSPIESPNPFKLENGGVTTNGVTPTSPVTESKHVEKPKYNGWKPPIERKPFLIIRKKFEPDPEAIERITGYKTALSKPPLPPPPVSHRNNLTLTSRLNRIELARKQYLDNKAALAANKVDGTKKFQQFLYQAQNDRAKIVTSVPDLVAIERAVTEQWTKERSSVSPRESPSREEYKKSDGVTLSRGSTPDDKWASYVQSCRQHLGRRSQSMTYLETDIDVIPVLDADDKYHSTSALDEPDEALPDPDDSDLDASREDLDDSGHAKSEHELRIERSLRSLPLPDWYRKSDKTKTGFLLGSSNKEKRGWAAAKSLASSTSSLASCGLRRPVRSLRSSRENIPWSRTSASPDGPTLSLALAKAFREPYLGWRARTPTSSGVSSSPRASPPSWGATTTDDEANGVSFDGEDAFGRTTSSEDDKRDEPLSLDDTGADAVTVSMDTNDPVKLPGGEDTCDDINNMSMDTCELFDASVVVPVDEDPSPQADTGDDIDNLSTDTTTTEGRKLNDPKLKRYSYSQSIYHSEWDEDEESRGERKVKKEDREPSPASSDHKVVWIESSFVGSRTTTSIMVLPEKKAPGSTQERPASR